MAPAALVASLPAPVPVGPATKKATRPTKPIPQSLIDGAKIGRSESSDPSKHLKFQPPKNIRTMKKIGLEGQGAIKQMRAEIFSEKVLEECQYSSTFNPNMIRGMGPARAPFAYDAWKSPEVLPKISEVAGIDLVTSFDFEIANINITIPSENQDIDEILDTPFADRTSAVAWHYDSFPFVCVTILSDCTGLVGGETALKTPKGEILKVRGPATGTAVVMQGRYIEHQALKAMGGRERISMVTCFCPKDPLVKDETVLVGVRGVSNISELYTQYTEYRMEILEERIRHTLKQEREREIAKRPFDIANTRSFLLEQKLFLDSMLNEIVELD
ncbi:hypothetical protein N7532_010133 [Penicillium argentinense]|uniref:Fe2OG dioxygenase domain-containing protein n=1 Tax=Penicillium argentinense TaxID=1131581 RepID=A0A9W9EP05_9EURO|nr:uncharacterized protein N7532_010133 [Penicillium argentinense]KAJ5085362.1 hypothetical protein N7532_010133 [Penicillium argentinense]